MKVLIGCVTAIITIILFSFLIVLCKRKVLDDKIERSMPQILYLLFLSLPIAFISIICEYITINPFICSLIWIFTIFVMDKVLTRKLLLSTKTETKVALNFLSMLLCAFYFLVMGIAKRSWEYIGMLSVAGALIIGFFVPIDVVLSDTDMKRKCVKIVRGIGLNNIDITTIVFYAMVLILFIVIATINNTEFGKEIKAPASVGVAVGYIVSLLMISIFFRGINNSISDCTDYRQQIFQSQVFKEYQQNIENKLGLSHEELYNHVEAFLYYSAFITNKKNGCVSLSNMVDQKVYELIQNDFPAVEKYRVFFDKRRNEYILKNGHKEFVYDCLVNPWEIFCFYIQQCSSELLENGNIPQEYILKYNSWGYFSKEERWLLFFLEKYHCLSRKAKNSIIPVEISSFVYYVYREQALWIVPKRCISYLQEEKNKNAFDKGNIILSIVYEWFEKKEQNVNTREFLKEKVEKTDYINAFESWLDEYENWENFVLSNKLNKLVEKKMSWNSYGFGKPKKICMSNSFSIGDKRERKEWLKALKETTDLFYYRF